MQAYRLLLTQAADLIRSHTGRLAPARSDFGPVAGCSTLAGRAARLWP